MACPCRARRCPINCVGEVKLEPHTWQCNDNVIFNAGLCVKSRRRPSHANWCTISAGASNRSGVEDRANSASGPGCAVNLKRANCNVSMHWCFRLYTGGIQKHSWGPFSLSSIMVASITIWFQSEAWCPFKCLTNSFFRWKGFWQVRHTCDSSSAMWGWPKRSMQASVSTACITRQCASICASLSWSPTWMAEWKLRRCCSRPCLVKKTLSQVVHGKAVGARWLAAGACCPWAVMYMAYCLITTQFCSRWKCVPQNSQGLLVPTWWSKYAFQSPCCLKTSLCASLQWRKTPREVVRYSPHKIHLWVK